jgi:uncharacterized membrane protein
VHKGRLEAFSDGVIAIIITIMVLELKAPHGDQPADLVPLLPVLLSYGLSFIYLGIYWSNHHHLLQAVRSVNGAVLWANLHLLFWLSLVPFGTAWIGENHFGTWPVALYGVILAMAACAYYILVRVLQRHHGADSAIAKAVGDDFKGRISIAIYLVAIPLAFAWSYAGYSLYLVVALMWLVPDRRFEKVLTADG